MKQKKENELMVVKSNSLIKQSKYSFTVCQHRIIQMLIALVSKYDTEFKEFRFNVKDFCELCGIETNNGKNYINIKNAIKSLSDKSSWILVDGYETLFRWIEQPRINTTTGEIILKLDSNLKVYLLQLGHDFTHYPFRNTMLFRSSYSFRLYDLLECVHYHDNESYDYKISFKELKARMGANDKYTWSHFRQRALDLAIDDINKYTYKYISYEAKKENGRAIDTIYFHIETKPVEERVRLDYDLFGDKYAQKVLKALLEDDATAEC